MAHNPNKIERRKERLANEKARRQLRWHEKQQAAKNRRRTK
jgi:hypothetical protein